MKDIMAAIRAEMTYEEINAVYWEYHEKQESVTENYYLPEILIDVCMKRIRNEIDDEYFKTWLIIISNLLSGDEKHGNLSWILDGFSFHDPYDSLKCREIISLIRDHDLRFQNPDVVRYHKRKKMKVIYLRFEYCNSENECIYKCYVIDHRKKTYDVRMVDSSEIDYDLSKNYCYIVDEEHEADIRRQEEDDTLECIDMSKPEKQFCETEEELISLIHESYKRDKSLSQ